MTGGVRSNAERLPGNQPGIVGSGFTQILSGRTAAAGIDEADGDGDGRHHSAPDPGPLKPTPIAHRDAWGLDSATNSRAHRLRGPSSRADDGRWWQPRSQFDRTRSSWRGACVRGQVRAMGRWAGGPDGRLEHEIVVAISDENISQDGPGASQIYRS